MQRAGVRPLVLRDQTETLELGVKIRPCRVSALSMGRPCGEQARQQCNQNAAIGHGILFRDGSTRGRFCDGAVTSSLYVIRPVNKWDGIHSVCLRKRKATE